MRKIISLLLFGFFLTGCYSSSLTMVGPATGLASGKLSETAASTSLNYVVKKETGKTPIEYILNENQIKTYEKKKAKLNPCKTNANLCALLSSRVNLMQKQLLGQNLQSRIEKKHQKIFSKIRNN
tara:strand:+ start:1361 stop:1735 length:375 start_codon:yes stop_codon:yes gene_type:complete